MLGQVWSINIRFVLDRSIYIRLGKVSSGSVMLIQVTLC